LPTFFIASAMIWPIASSALAEMVPTWAMALSSVQGLDSFFSSSTVASDRLVDAALQIHRVHAGGDGFHAFADDGLGQHGRGGGAVAGDIGSLGRDLLHHLRAHVLELVFQLDSLATDTPSLVTVGAPKGFVEQHVAALGTEGDLDGVGQNIDAAHHARAGVITELDFFCSHLWGNSSETFM
jgi:hypothetical protein